MIARPDTRCSAETSQLVVRSGSRPGLPMVNADENVSSNAGALNALPTAARTLDPWPASPATDARPVTNVPNVVVWSTRPLAVYVTRCAALPMTCAYADLSVRCAANVVAD